MQLPLNECGGFLSPSLFLCYKLFACAESENVGCIHTVLIQLLSFHNYYILPRYILLSEVDADYFVA